MRKFTEDNWKIDMSSCVSDECTHTFIYPEHLRIEQIDEDVYIALARIYEDDKGSYDECYANARLIASAPEMYELLKVWVNVQAQPTLRNAQARAQELLARIDGEEEDL